MIRRVLVPLAMFLWLLILRSTGFVYSVYLLVGILGLFAFYLNEKSGKKIGREISIEIISVVFSAAIVLANHDIVLPFDFPLPLVFIPLFIGGYFVARHILLWLKLNLSKLKLGEYSYKMSPTKVFLLSFGILSLMYLVIFFLCCYPGVLTTDSVSQMQQIQSGQFSNHHPFYHSIIIKLFYCIGMGIFHDENAAIACYSVFSILMMAAIFAYAATTLYQAKLNKKWVIIFICLFALLPCYIVGSFTMWKDIPFAGGALLFTVATYRYLMRIGKNCALNFVMMLVGALMICLLRSNGLFAFAFVVLFVFILFRKKHLKMCLSLTGVFALSLIMQFILGPVFHVEPTENTEALSVPLQQVARTVVDNGNISDEERQSITKIADVDAIKQNYLPYLSDPMKLLVRNGGKESYLSEHKVEYAKLWFDLGLKNPKSYTYAWADLTRGYWNGGTYYWNVVTENEYSNEARSGFFVDSLDNYIKLFNDSSLLRLFTSIGLFVWMTLLVLFVAVLSKNKTVAFLTVAPLAIVFSLLISTPVYAEFRYAYAVFCCLPFLALVAFTNPKALKRQ